MVSGRSKASHSRQSSRSRGGKTAQAAKALKDLKARHAAQHAAQLTRPRGTRSSPRLHPPRQGSMAPPQIAPTRHEGLGLQASGTLGPTTPQDDDDDDDKDNDQDEGPDDDEELEDATPLMSVPGPRLRGSATPLPATAAAQHADWEQQMLQQSKLQSTLLRELVKGQGALLEHFLEHAEAAEEHLAAIRDNGAGAAGRSTKVPLKQPLEEAMVAHSLYPGECIYQHSVAMALDGESVAAARKADRVLFEKGMKTVAKTAKDLRFAYGANLKMEFKMCFSIGANALFDSSDDYKENNAIRLKLKGGAYRKGKGADGRGEDPFGNEHFRTAVFTWIPPENANDSSPDVMTHISPAALAFAVTRVEFWLDNGVATPLPTNDETMKAETRRVQDWLESQEFKSDYVTFPIAESLLK